MKKGILKLNSSYFPIAVADYKEVIKNICSGTVFPLDIEYGLNEHGKISTDVVENCVPVRSWEDWVNLPVRDYDDYITSVFKKVRLPSVVICADFKRIIFNKVIFPTNKNIWKRDNFTCLYTGKKLSKHELSVDHVIPTSRGGEDSWTNKVTCDRYLNSCKGDKNPEEAGLKLIRRPYTPKSGGLIFNKTRPEWNIFIP